MTTLFAFTAVIGLLAGPQTRSAERQEAVEWTGSVAAVQLIWTTARNLRTGETKQSLSLGIFQIRDKSGEERRVTADADDTKVKVLDAKGAPFSMSEVRKGARLQVRAVKHAKAEGAPGLDYWEASELVIQANGHEEAPPSKKPSNE